MDIFDCVKCKGRFCGGGARCPLLAKLRSHDRIRLEGKQDFIGDAPNIFVGRAGYPNIDVGFLATEEDHHHDDPAAWVREGYGIQDVIDRRSSLINSSFRADVRGLRNRWLEMGREIAMACEPADVEINLTKKPSFAISPSHDVTPSGPTIRLKNAVLLSNPKIPTKVEKVVSETDLLATEGIRTLSDKGIDEHYLTRLLSSGNLGVAPKRRLVPTRWSITAVDDSLGKQAIEEVKDFTNRTDHQLFVGSHFGNYYLILTFPDVWSFELFETYVGERTKASFSTDHEGYAGRKTYAHDTAGGYYAARLAVLEGLVAMKRQGSVLALRFITDEYWAPLGVWVVREAARNSMRSSPITFGSKELLLAYVRNLVTAKFGYDVDEILRKSRLLHDIGSQMKLGAYL